MYSIIAHHVRHTLLANPSSPAEVPSWFHVTFLKEKNDSGLEWQRAGIPSLQQSRPAQPRFYIFYSCGAAHTFVLPFRIEQRAFLFICSAASSSGNKSGHLKKG